MSLQTDIKGEMVGAMKAREALKLSVLRGLIAAFTNELVAKGRKPDEELSDEDVLAVISRAARQRKDSIEQFEKGGRSDLASAEKEEFQILENYLPKQMSKEEVESYIMQKISTGSFTKENKNQFMGIIMKELKGRVDGTLVRDVIDKTLI